MSSIAFSPHVSFTASRTFCQEQSPDLCSHLLNIFLGLSDFSVSISSKTCGSKSNRSPTLYQTAAIRGATKSSKCFKVGRVVLISDPMSLGSALKKEAEPERVHGIIDHR